MKASRLFAGLCALFVWSGGASVAEAQSVLSLEAGRDELAAGERLELRIATERAGATGHAAWPGGFEWFLVRVAGTQRNLARLPPAEPGGDFAALELPREGVTLIAFDLAPRVELVAPDELGEFLTSRVGLAAPAGKGADPGAAPIRVRRIESCKLLVRVVGDEGWLPSSATAQSKTGQRVEIRPLGDPTSVRARTDLPVRVYLPAPDQRASRVIARHLESEAAQSFSVDRFGTGYFTVTRPGAWRVEAHGARALEDDPEADWEVATATLSFVVPAWDPREGDPAAPGKGGSR